MVDIIIWIAVVFTVQKTKMHAIVREPEKERERERVKALSSCGWLYSKQHIQNTICENNWIDKIKHTQKRTDSEKLKQI